METPSRRFGMVNEIIQLADSHRIEDPIQLVWMVNEAEQLVARLADNLLHHRDKLDGVGGWSLGLPSHTAFFTIETSSMGPENPRLQVPNHLGREKEIPNESPLVDARLGHRVTACFPR